MAAKCIAFDIGAESGRAILGSIVKGKLETSELARFLNTPQTLNGTVRWNIDNLTSQVHSITEANAHHVTSVGIDTWGVDFVLLKSSLELVEQPFHYRDHRTDGVMARTLDLLTPEFVYGQTGIQFLPFNSLFQLLAMVESPSLAEATHFLTIPDYLHLKLSHGAEPRCEFTNATTTQCFNPTTGTWATELLDRLSIPTTIFPTIVPAGTQLGTFPGSQVQVIVPASHDTASAVVAVPQTDENSVWISSGTWSILGTDTVEPLISPETLRNNWTNEGAYNSTYRLCKNVAGLWLLQSCRAQWEREGQTFGYGELAQLASNTASPELYFNPDDPRLLAPVNMVAAIDEILLQSGQKLPVSPAERARAIFENLAFQYRFNIETLTQISGKNFRNIHIVGGGSQIALLNQITANVCGVPVIAGPTEATAIGNLLVQFITLGELGSVSEGRELVRRSFALQTFVPEQVEAWESRYQCFKNLVRSSLSS